MLNRAVRVSTSIALATAVLTLSESAAVAGNFGAPIGASVQSNKWVFAYYTNLPIELAQHTTWVRGNSINADSRHGLTSPGTSDHSVTDIAIDADYGSSGPQASQWGWAGCPSVSGGVCVHGHATYNTYNTNQATSGWPIRATMCQEIGHLLGLGHRYASDSCMQNLGAYYYGAHDAGHLAAQYGTVK